MQFSKADGPIGVFDSGYGGLTVYDKIRERLPQYDYMIMLVRLTAPVHLRLYMNLQDKR